MGPGLRPGAIQPRRLVAPQRAKSPIENRGMPGFQIKHKFEKPSQTGRLFGFLE